jgi:Flp pilus assembly protein TadB
VIIMGFFLPVSYSLAIIVTFVAIMAFLMWAAEKKDAAERMEQRMADEAEQRIRQVEREITELGQQTRNSLIAEALRRATWRDRNER